MSTKVFQSRTAEMINWFAKNHYIEWFLIDEDPVTPEKCIEFIDKLSEKGYYEMIYILLLKNEHERIIGRALRRMRTEILAGKWEETGNSNMCEEIKSRILYEIEQAKLRKNKE